MIAVSVAPMLARCRKASRGGSFCLERWLPRAACLRRPAEAGPLFAYIGCFTSERRKAHSKGISVYRIDANGSWSLVQTLETLPNPQFIAFDQRQKFLYSVHGDGTEVSSYAIDKASGRISFLNKQPTSGNNSTHLTPDPTNRYIVIGNGIGVAVFPINSDGSLAPYSDMVPAGGDVGPHRNQVGPGPHPHFVGFDPSGRFLLAPDRGTDRTLIYRLDPASGKLLPNNPAFARSRPGAGPRHLAFHPAKPWAYVCDELDSTVTAYAWDSGRGELKPFQVITTLPEDYVGGNTTAEIQLAPSAHYLYVSNRGHNSIAVFAIGPEGKLTSVEYASTQGQTPRNFQIDPTGRYLFAANQDSGNVVQFRIDPTSGRLTPTGASVAIPEPVCLLFVPRKAK
jgi:6-phosphogluconolactonase (cycloisomerase 2 family)